jgi:transcriptional regulator with XRE-family HTH domain
MDNSKARARRYSDLIYKTKTLRKDNLVTQNEMSERLGIAQCKISAYENGKISPKLDLYLQYLDELGYTIDIKPKEGA